MRSKCFRKKRCTKSLSAKEIAERRFKVRND